MIHILFGKSPSIVRNRDFHILFLLAGIYIYPTSRLGIFPCNFRQGVKHEKSERLIRLHHHIGRFYGQSLLLQFKILPALLNDLEQGIQFKVLDIQIQRTLTHLDPQGKDVVILIDASHQLIQIFVFANLYLLVAQIVEGNELVHLIDDSIYVRSDARNDEQTSLLDQVLTLVLDEVLLMHILFLFDALAFILQGNEGASVLQCPGKARHNHFEQGLVLLLQRGIYIDIPTP